jgi:hypothetical protein
MMDLQNLFEFSPSILGVSNFHESNVVYIIVVFRATLNAAREPSMFWRTFSQLAEMTNKI